MAQLKLTKLQKLGVRPWREKKNQILHSHQNHGKNKKTIQNQAAGLHKSNKNLFHLLQCCQVSVLLNCNLWDTSRCTITHAYLLVQDFFFNKNHFLDVLLVGCNVALQQLNIFAAYHSTNIIQNFHACRWATRKRKRPALRAFLQRYFTNVTNHTEFFYIIALLRFHKYPYRTYRNGLNQVPQS